jgi:hypothetical protein
LSGAASDPAITTPHESARGGPDAADYIPILSHVNEDITSASLTADSAARIAYNARSQFE